MPSSNVWSLKTKDKADLSSAKKIHKNRMKNKKINMEVCIKITALYIASIETSKVQYCFTFTPMFLESENKKNFPERIFLKLN